MLGIAGRTDTDFQRQVLLGRIPVGQVVEELHDALPDDRIGRERLVRGRFFAAEPARILWELHVQPDLLDELPLPNDHGAKGVEARQLQLQPSEVVLFKHVLPFAADRRILPIRVLFREGSAGLG